MNEETMRVLKMVEEGKITAEEGAELLDALRNKEPIFSGQFFKSGFAKDMTKMAKDMAKMGRDFGLNFARSVSSDLGGTEAGEPFERELEVSPEGELLLKNFSGEISVKSWEKPAVRIQATKYARGRTEEEARENARQIGIDVRQDKHILRIDTNIPFLGHAQTRGGRVDYEISVPQRFNLKLRSMSGDVKAKGAHGNVKIDTKSGDVGVQEIQGDVEVACLSGDVIMENIKGNSTVKSLSGDVAGKDIAGGNTKFNLHSGDVDLTRLQGNLILASLSGDVHLVDMDCGKVEVDSKSGDIDIAGGVKPEGDYLLKTLSGNLKIRIPRDASVQIEALSRTGHISYTLPLKIEKESSSELHGILGEGKARIKLIALSGDISLEHRE